MIVIHIIIGIALYSIAWLILYGIIYGVAILIALGIVALILNRKVTKNEHQ